MTIYTELTKSSLEKTISEMAGKEYSYLKKRLADALIDEKLLLEKKFKNCLKISRT